MPHFEGEHGEVTLEHAFKVFDELLKIEPGGEDLSIPNIAVAGGQSVGKSSLLSQLLNIFLWSSEGTATHGPTQIHSRRTDDVFSATVEIEYNKPARGVKKRVTFTEQPLTSPKRLVEVLHWARDEARRTRNGASKVRTYEQLLRMGDERIKGSEEWDEYTQNVVVLYVRGIEQPNLSIIDLPGLVTGEGEAVTVATAEKYLKKPNTLILLCVAAGGSDPTSGQVDKLVAEWDPKGERTFGLITKADLIATANSGFIPLIAGKHKNLRYQPKFGWSPVRLRTAQEFEDQIGPTEFAAVQDVLFNNQLWRAIATHLKRDFSWRHLQDRIGTEFERRVLDTVLQLRRRVTAGLTAVCDAERRLGPESADPCGELFDMIDKLRDSLRDEFTNGWDTTSTLLRLQQQLPKALMAHVPEFVPMLKADFVDQERERTGKAGRAGDADDDGSADETDYSKYLFLDDLHERLMKTGNARLCEPQKGAVRFDLVQKHTEQWANECLQFNNSVWSAVDDIIAAVVDKICKGEQVKNRVLAALRAQALKFRDEAREYVVAAAESERADPSLVETFTPRNAGKTHSRQHEYIQYFIDRYEPPGFMPAVVPPQPGPGPSSSSSTPMTPTSPRPHPSVIRPDPADQWLALPPAADTHPRQWNRMYMFTIFNVAASVSRQLDKGAQTLGRVVGHKVMILVHKYLSSVGPPLREALFLNRVEPKVVAFAKRSLTDPETSRKRLKVANEKETWKKIEALLDQPQQ